MGFAQHCSINNNLGREHDEHPIWLLSQAFLRGFLIVEDYVTAKSGADAGLCVVCKYFPSQPIQLTLITVNMKKSHK